MGKLTCSRCFAIAEAESQEEADALIDHARGQMIGRPCSGKESDLHWDGRSGTSLRATVIVEEEVAEEKPKKKSKRS